MTGSPRRHAPFMRALVLLGATALVALVALAGLLAGSRNIDSGHSAAAAAAAVHGHAQGVALGADHHPAAEQLPSIHPAISTRGPRITFALPAAVVVVAAWIFQRLRLARSGRFRALDVFGLPLGRAPPALRIA